MVHTNVDVHFACVARPHLLHVSRMHMCQAPTCQAEDQCDSNGMRAATSRPHSSLTSVEAVMTVHAP